MNDMGTLSVLRTQRRFYKDKLRDKHMLDWGGQWCIGWHGLVPHEHSIGVYVAIKIQIYSVYTKYGIRLLECTIKFASILRIYSYEVTCLKEVNGRIF